MVRRRFATAIGALCLTSLIVGGPVVSAQTAGPGAQSVVTDLPVLSELPPLPPEGGARDPVPRRGRADVADEGPRTADPTG